VPQKNCLKEGGGEKIRKGTRGEYRRREVFSHMHCTTKSQEGCNRGSEKVTIRGGGGPLTLFP